MLAGQCDRRVCNPGIRAKIIWRAEEELFTSDLTYVQIFVTSNRRFPWYADSWRWTSTKSFSSDRFLKCFSIPSSLARDLWPFFPDIVFIRISNLSSVWWQPWIIDSTFCHKRCKPRDSAGERPVEVWLFLAHSPRVWFTNIRHSISCYKVASSSSIRPAFFLTSTRKLANLKQTSRNSWFPQLLQMGLWTRRLNHLTSDWIQFVRT